jgi:membrane protein implicated in regulation of membrane protease activity
VRINGELWRAETELADQPLPSGSPVTVRAFRGLTLIVAPEENVS